MRARRRREGTPAIIQSVPLDCSRRRVARGGPVGREAARGERCCCCCCCCCWEHDFSRLSQWHFQEGPPALDSGDGERGQEAVRPPRRPRLRGDARRLRSRRRLPGLQLAEEPQRREGVPRGRAEHVHLPHKHVAHRQLHIGHRDPGTARRDVRLRHAALVHRNRRLLRLADHGHRLPARLLRPADHLLLRVPGAEVQPRGEAHRLLHLPPKNAALHPAGHLRAGAGVQPSDRRQPARDRLGRLRRLHILHDAGRPEGGRVDRRDPDDRHVRRRDRGCAAGNCPGRRLVRGLEAQPRDRPHRVLQHGPQPDGQAHLLDGRGRELPELAGDLLREPGDGPAMPRHAEPQKVQHHDSDHGGGHRRDSLAELLHGHRHLRRLLRLRPRLQQGSCASASSLYKHRGYLTSSAPRALLSSHQQIRKPDQLLPFFVMELAQAIPGLPGLFVSGVFSAALSTMSTGLNSMSGVIYEDMIKPCLRKPMSDVAASRLMKLTVLLVGVVCLALVLLVEKLSGLIQAGKSLSGITAGPLLGIFTLGMFFPFANSRGAIAGALVSLNLVAWISFGTQAALASGKIRFPVKPVSLDGCPDGLKLGAANLTLVLDSAAAEETPFFLYRMSYLWYTWVGFLTAIIVGLLVSWITGPNNYKPADYKLYTPLIRGLLCRGKDTKADAAELEKIDERSSKC